MYGAGLSFVYDRRWFKRSLAIFWLEPLFRIGTFFPSFSDDCLRKGFVQKSIERRALPGKPANFHLHSHFGTCGDWKFLGMVLIWSCRFSFATAAAAVVWLICPTANSSSS
nr:hypothetical protein CFP56_52279 [Quercus suber]